MHRTGSSEHLKRYWAVFILLLVLAWPVMIWLATALYAFMLNSDSTYPESAVLHNVGLAAQDGHLYRSLLQPPFTPAPYGPVFYAFLAAASRIFSLDYSGLQTFGRLFSFSSFICVLGLLYSLARRWNMPPLMACLAPVFFAALHDVVPWNSTARPDFPAMALALIGFYIFTQQKKSEDNLVLAGLCFALAMMMKQSYVAAALTVFIHLIQGKMYRLACTLVVSIAGCVAVCLFVPYFHGDAIMANLSVLGHSTVEIPGAWEILSRELLLPGVHFPFIICAALGLYWSKGVSQTFIVRDYMLIAWFLGIMGVLRIGADTNSYLEACMVSSIFVAYGIHHLYEKAGNFSILALVLMVLIFAQLPETSLHGVDMQKRKQMPDLSAFEPLVKGRSVLTDEPYLAAQSPQPVVLDAFFNSLLDSNGFGDPHPVIHMLQSHGFDLVILNVEDRYIRRHRGLTYFSVPVLKAINQDYRLVCRMPKVPGFSKFMVWAPKQKPLEPSLMSVLHSLDCI